MTEELNREALNHLKAVLMHTPPNAGYIELRAIPRVEGLTPKTEWIPTAVSDGVLYSYVNILSNWNEQGHDIYLGYNARGQRGKGKQKDVQYMTAAYVDLDVEKFGITREQARQAVNEALVAPNLIVDSGHGLHV